MKTFEIWAEGFCATGCSGTARMLGTAEGEDFLDACQRWGSRPENTELFHVSDATGTPLHWGRVLFDNEADARKVFG